MKHIAFPVLLTLLAGCANQPIYPPAPAKAQAGAHWNYLLGPGDSVNVFVWATRRCQAPSRSDPMAR